MRSAVRYALKYAGVLAGLTVAGVVFTGTADAQVTCTSASATPSTIRAEGLTEQLPALSISGCTGTTDTASITFTVTTNTLISNTLLTGTSTNSTDAVASVSGFPGAPSSVVSGQLINSTTLQFTFAVTAPSTVNGSITVSNIRVNASVVPVGSLISVTPSSGTGIILMTSTPTAAFTVFSLTTPKFTAYSSVAFSSTHPADVNAVGTVGISENFAGALTTAAEEYAKETSSGASALANNPITSGSTVGLHIALTFSNLANGVTYYLPASLTSGPLTLVAVPSASSTVALASTIIGGSSNAGNTGAGTSVSGVYALTPSSGSFYPAVSRARGGDIGNGSGYPEFTPPSPPTSVRATGHILSYAAGYNGTNTSTFGELDLTTGLFTPVTTISVHVSNSPVCSGPFAVPTPSSPCDAAMSTIALKTTGSRAAPLDLHSDVARRTVIFVPKDPLNPLRSTEAAVSFQSKHDRAL